MQTTASHSATSSVRAHGDSSALTLDSLLDMTPDELQELYRNARVPRLTDVHGDLRGRMLAWPIFEKQGTLQKVAHMLGAWDHFPWRGKSFTPRSEDRGDGINRVGLDRFHLYRFETFVGRSRAGDFDAVQLDYDVSPNPFFIRAIKDEIREIAPKLYLGQAYLQVRGDTHLVLYFGLEG